MIRVGFLNAGSKEWIAQVHYLKNLLYALSTLPDRQVQPVVFFGLKADEEIVASLAPYAEIIRTSLLDRGSLPRVLYRLVCKISGNHTILNWYLKSKGISALFHSDINDRNMPFKLINWIPDFQYLHLPEMFPEAELNKRRRLDIDIINNSNVVVLSSHDALRDYQAFAPDQTHKARVMQFVSQPFSGEEAYRCTVEQLASRYGFSGKYFYLPNQFWKHKNHLVVFRAVKELREQGNDVLLLCSGHMRDDRNRDHMESLLRFVTENGLEDHIKFLGLIPYGDVVSLMRNAVSVINPSLFEGWSSTVEEAKSIGKNLILSDIAVHREQDPPSAIFFDPRDAKELSVAMRDKWNRHPGGPDLELEAAAKIRLQNRTERFARCFQDIVQSVVGFK